MLSCIPPLGLPLYDPVRGELRDSTGCWQNFLILNMGIVMGGWCLLQRRPGSASLSSECIHCSSNST